MSKFEYHVYTTPKGSRKVQRNLIGENNWETIGSLKDVDLSNEEVISILNEDGRENAFSSFILNNSPIEKKIIGTLEYDGLSASLILHRFEAKARDSGWKENEIERVIDKATAGNFQYMIDTLSNYFVTKQEKHEEIKGLKKGEYYIGDIKGKLEEKLFEEIIEACEKDGKEHGIVKINGESIGYVSIEGKDNFSITDYHGIKINLEVFDSGYIFIIGSSDFHLHNIKEESIHEFEKFFNIEEEEEGIIYIGDIEINFSYTRDEEVDEEE